MIKRAVLLMGKRLYKRRKSGKSVQVVKRTTSEHRRQMISSKQVAKIMKRGEPVFLVVIRPTSQSGQGMTQKAKQQIMKETGPIRKAPPVAETRKRICNEAPTDIRTELHDLLKEYADLFPEKLPKG